VLAEIWAGVLRLERIGVNDNFFELGGDSILSIQVAARAGEAGLRLSAQQVFRYQTLAELAAVADTGGGAEAQQEPAAGPVPLTPIQSWFFEQELAAPHHYNQALLVGLRGAPRADLLEWAVARLLQHHDALRLRYTRTESGWFQHNDPPGIHTPCCLVDLGALPEELRRSTVESVAAALQGSLDLSRGPLLRVAILRVGAASARLVFIIHHLAVDGVSWRVLLEDLTTLYRGLERGVDARLPAKTTSFKRWAERLVEHARSTAMRGELSFWAGMAGSRTSRLPLDHSGGSNLTGAAATVSVWLDTELTQALLQEVPRAYHTQINEVLLAALLQAFTRWTGEKRLLIDLEGHGREELDDRSDLSRTVGWFTSLFPVALDLGRAAGPGQALVEVKEQLRSIPKRGIGYGLLRYLSGEPEIVEQLRSLPVPEVSFNYLGQLDRVLPDSSPFLPAEESLGPSQAAVNRRPFLLEILGSVAGGRLRMDWIYGTELHRRETIERLASWYSEAVKALVAHCRSPEAGGFTPADFPQSSLNIKDLGKVLSKLGGAGVRRGVGHGKH
jgi:non-ribosomal peptide synthase protein (TIGR01720 family)